MRSLGCLQRLALLFNKGLAVLSTLQANKPPLFVSRNGEVLSCANGVQTNLKTLVSWSDF